MPDFFKLNGSFLVVFIIIGLISLFAGGIYAMVKYDEIQKKADPDKIVLDEINKTYTINGVAKPTKITVYTYVGSEYIYTSESSQ